LSDTAQKVRAILSRTLRELDDAIENPSVSSVLSGLGSLLGVDDGDSPAAPAAQASPKRGSGASRRSGVVDCAVATAAGRPARTSSAPTRRAAAGRRAWSRGPGTRSWQRKPRVMTVPVGVPILFPVGKRSHELAADDDRLRAIEHLGADLCGSDRAAIKDSVADRPNPSRASQVQKLPLRVSHAVGLRPAVAAQQACRVVALPPRQWRQLVRRKPAQSEAERGRVNHGEVAQVRRDRAEGRR
jgi:hypothetical protein